jgi:DNA-binding GntR family transcriptional regulator
MVTRSSAKGRDGKADRRGIESLPDKSAVPKSRELDFQPRYARVAQTLIEEISSGKFAVGSLIATEAELCSRFGVSRNTARSALTILSDMGLVTRHAGIGTAVRSLTAEARYVQEAESVSALFPNMEATEQRTLSERAIRADTALSKLLDCRRGDQWNVVESLRSIKKHQLPVAYSHLYLPVHLAHLAKHFDRLSAPAYTVIDRKSKSRVAKMHQETSACAVPDVAAQRLGVEAGSPGMQIIRRYFSEDAQPLLVSTTIYPAGRYSFSFAITLPPA